MSRISHFLLLIAALAAITYVATRSLQLPPVQVLVLLAAGVLAQGFASWRPAQRKFRGFEQPRRSSQVLAWLFRAVLGCAVLAGLVAAALWALPQASPLPWLGG